ncbi:MAG: S41 family peptidase [Pseudomonadota bacterium]
MTRRIFVACIVFVSALILGCAATGPEPLIENGAFESVGDDQLPSNWTIQSFGHATSVEDGVLVIDSAVDPRSTLINQVLTGEQLRSGSLRFSGELKTEGVEISATLVAMVRGGDRTLFMDDMRDRVVAGDTEWRRYTIDIPTIADAEELEVGMLLIGPGKVWFDNLTLERFDDRGEPGVARAYLAAAVEILEEQYLRSERIDWNSISDSAALSLRDDSSLTDAHGAVASLFARLDDPHAQFVRPRDEDPRAAVDDARPIIRIEEQTGVAYVEVPRWSSPATSPASTALIRETHQGTSALAPAVCGWIVDLSENTGGNMWPMLAALGPLLGREDVGGFVGFDSTELTTTWWYRDGVSGARERDVEVPRTAEIENVAPRIPVTEPVAVIVGSDTSSSGEALAMAFLGRENVRFFGQPTAGWTTANVAVPLSDGGILVFPSAYMADSSGQAYPDGVIPDEMVDSVKAPRTAVEWLKGHSACDR